MMCVIFTYMFDINCNKHIYDKAFYLELKKLLKTPLL